MTHDPDSRELVEKARRRDEAAAEALGEYTPLAHALDDSAKRNNIAERLIELAEAVADVPVAHDLALVHHEEITVWVKQAREILRELREG
jgi:hypothetical protein